MPPPRPPSPIIVHGPENFLCYPPAPSSVYKKYDQHLHVPIFGGIELGSVIIFYLKRILSLARAAIIKLQGWPEQEVRR